VIAVPLKPSEPVIVAVSALAARCFARDAVGELKPVKLTTAWVGENREKIPVTVQLCRTCRRQIRRREEAILTGKAASKPAFRSAFRDRRCLILTDGSYEWQKLEDRKQPYYIQRRDGRLFAFPGLWENWSKGESPVQSCTILTANANELMRPLHDRMPLILDPGNFDRWLEPTPKEPAEIQPFPEPCPADWLEAVPVSTHVNNARHEDGGCVVPLRYSPEGAATERKNTPPVA